MAENLKSKAWWLLLHTERESQARRRNPLPGGLVEEVDFFIPVIQWQHLQLFFSETDTCFIAYLHSWIAETSNKPACLSDRALRGKASQRRTLKAIHMAFFLPLLPISVTEQVLSRYEVCWLRPVCWIHREAQAQRNKMDFVSLWCTELWPGFV